MKKEFGKWLMDIAKYIITAVILSSVFGKSDNESVVYIGGGILSIVIVFWGLYLQKDSKNTSKKKRR
jgi:hypothetical protein